MRQGQARTARRARRAARRRPLPQARRPRGVKRAEALAKALDAAAHAPKPARAARARAHASEVVDLPDGEWHDIDINGVPARRRATEDAHDGATPTQVLTMEAEAVQKADGATITVRTNVRRTISFEACPDADGVAHGTYELRKIERKEVVKGTERAFAETHTTSRAAATVHVGDAPRSRAPPTSARWTSRCAGPARRPGATS